MTKRQYLLIFFIVLFAVVAVWYFQKPISDIQGIQTSLSNGVPKINGRRVLNLPSGQESVALKQIKLNNRVTENWQEAVEKGLKIQGGDELKKVDIKKIESLIWTGQGFALNVESVAITLSNSKNERTSFRALVDSQTGKIIQTWDQPVMDPINPKDNFGVKVDPRYLND